MPGPRRFLRIIDQIHNPREQTVKKVKEEESAWKWKGARAWRNKEHRLCLLFLLFRPVFAPLMKERERPRCALLWHSTTTTCSFASQDILGKAVSPENFYLKYKIKQREKPEKESCLCTSTRFTTTTLAPSRPLLRARAVQKVSFSLKYYLFPHLWPAFLVKPRGIYSKISVCILCCVVSMCILWLKIFNIQILVINSDNLKGWYFWLSELLCWVWQKMWQKSIKSAWLVHYRGLTTLKFFFRLFHCKNHRWIPFFLNLVGRRHTI